MSFENCRMMTDDDSTVGETYDGMIFTEDTQLVEETQVVDDAPPLTEEEDLCDTVLGVFLSKEPAFTKMDRIIALCLYRFLGSRLRHTATGKLIYAAATETVPAYLSLSKTLRHWKTVNKAMFCIDDKTIQLEIDALAKHERFDLANYSAEQFETMLQRATRIADDKALGKDKKRCDKENLRRVRAFEVCGDRIHLFKIMD